MPGRSSAGRRRARRSRPCGHPAGRPSSRVQRASRTRRLMGSDGSVPGTRRQKARKSCSPSRASAAAAMARRSSGSATCQVETGQQGVGHRGVDHQVAVAPGRGRVAGVESVGGDLGRAHHDPRADLAVAGLHQGGRVEGGRPVGGQVDVDDLVEGVHAGVGAPGAGQGDRGAGHPGQGRGQGPGHGVEALLGGEAVEPAAVVGQPEPPADGGSLTPPVVGGHAHTSSMRAIGALSP